MEDLNCPWCKKLFMAGAVTINGELYKCVNCEAWFKEENGEWVCKEGLASISGLYYLHV